MAFLMPQLLKDFSLIAETGVVLGGRCHLEHQLLIIPRDQQGNGTGTGAETLLHNQAARQPVAHLGLSRVVDHVVFGVEQLLLDLVEVFEEVAG